MVGLEGKGPELRGHRLRVLQLSDLGSVPLSAKSVGHSRPTLEVTEFKLPASGGKVVPYEVRI